MRLLLACVTHCVTENYHATPTYSIYYILFYFMLGVRTALSYRYIVVTSLPL